MKHAGSRARAPKESREPMESNEPRSLAMAQAVRALVEGIPAFFAAQRAGDAGRYRYAAGGTQPTL